MYAYIPEIGGGFFEGVCAPSNATANFCDPPPPTPSCHTDASQLRGAVKPDRYAETFAA